jgi:hypothetical protein
MNDLTLATMAGTVVILLTSRTEVRACLASSVICHGKQDGGDQCERVEGGDGSSEFYRALDVFDSFLHSSISAPPSGGPIELSFGVKRTFKEPPPETRSSTNKNV